MVIQEGVFGSNAGPRQVLLSSIEPMTLEVKHQESPLYGYDSQFSIRNKKLKLNLKDVGEILTRDQLKQVFGGSGSGIGSCVVTCEKPGHTYTATVPRYFIGCLRDTGYVMTQCVGVGCR